MMRIKFLSGIIIFGMLLASMGGMYSSAAAISFKDTGKHWAMADIGKAVEAGFVKGYTDNTFKPDLAVKRAEFISMLNRAFAVPLDGTGSSFKDVLDSDWFARDIWSAVKEGYLNLYDGDTLNPNQPLSRQEAAALTANLTKISAAKETKSFKDTDQIAAWALQQVDALVNAGIMNGGSDGYFRPEGSITRAEAVALINRAKTYTDSAKIEAQLTVTGSTVNIRSGPDTAYSVVAKAKKGEKLTAGLHSPNNWYKVSIGGKTGWIIGSYVTAASMGAAADGRSVTNRGGDVDRGNSAGEGDTVGGNTSTNGSIGITTGGGINSTTNGGITGAEGGGTDSAAQTGDAAGESTGTPGGSASEENRDAVEGKLIAVDAGHGGKDDGASGLNGTKEKNITLAIALKLSSLLKEAGYSVLLTRSDDTYIALDERSAAANNAKAALFVSVHCNSSTSHNGYGTETYTETTRIKPVYASQEDSRRLAGLVQSELVKALTLNNRGTKEQDLSVCRKTNAPAILVETAFIDNREEEKLLNETSFQEKAAAAIKLGIDAYFAE